MNRFLIIAFCTLFLADTSICQTESYDQKVRKMLTLSGAAANFDVAVTNMLELQRKSFQDLLGDEYFDQMEIEMKKIGIEKLIPKFTPIYRKHLTEEDLDGIIAFYESEPGKKLAEKTPLIIKDAMDIGVEWGEEIAQEILRKIESSNEYLINTDLQEDLSRFKLGKFSSYAEDAPSEIVHIERTEENQIEKYNGRTMTLVIEWTDNNKYTLSYVDEDSIQAAGQTEEPPGLSVIEVTIYEASENEYRYIARLNGIFTKGIIKKTERKM